MSDPNSPSREDVQDLLQAFANYRSAASNTEAQLHLELAKASRRINELESRLAKPAASGVSVPLSPVDSEAA